MEKNHVKSEITYEKNLLEFNLQKVFKLIKKDDHLELYNFMI